MSAAKNEKKKKKARFHVGDRVLLLYGPRQVEGYVVEDRGPLGAHGRRIFLIRADLGQDEEATFEVPEDNLEHFSQATEDKASPGPRVEFSVTYTRQGSSRKWQAETKPGRVHQGVEAKGAVAYSTARWEGDAQDDEKRSIVTVFLEPTPGDADARIAEARRLADRMFMRRHPEAQIEE
jgi:hypothetical protein